jgi:branched-subunit amino acid transport protein AzlD
MLIIYCLKGVSVFTFPSGLPEFISIILIVVIHIWKRNTLFSISGGTMFYMALVQYELVMILKDKYAIIV